MSAVHPRQLTAGLAVGLAPLSCVLITRTYSSVAGHASDDQGLGSFDDTIFVAKLSRVRN